MNDQAERILRQLKAGEYAPVYVLQGDEPYYIDLIARYLEEHAVTASQRAFNRIILYGKEVDVPRLLTHARRFPVMAPRQVIIVREAQEMTDLLFGEGGKMMGRYVARPAPTTVLALCYKYKTLDRRSALAKQADKQVVFASFKKLYESQLPAFVRRYVKDKGRRIGEEGVALLCEYVGQQLTRLASELDKLLIDTPQGEEITTQKIMSQVGVSREYNVFELQDALAARDVQKAYRIALHFAGNPKKNPILPAVAFLYSFYSRLLVASALPHRDERQIVEVLKVAPFLARRYLAAARRYSTSELETHIHRLAEADYQLKGGQGGVLTEGPIFTELVRNLAAAP